MKYIVVPVTPFEQICSIVYCEKTYHAAVVDPGGDIGLIIDAATKSNLTIEKIILTHGDEEAIDWMGSSILKRHKNIKVQIAEVGKEIRFF